MTDTKAIAEKTNLQAVHAAPARGSLVLLDTGDVQLLLPAGEVVSLLPINRLQVSADELACGSLEFEGQRLPVFYLNRQLQLQVPPMDRCNLLLILVASQCRFALAGCDLQKYTDPVPVFYPVPISMSSRKQPFSEFAVINNKPVGLTNAQELLRVLRLRGAVIRDQATSHTFNNPSPRREVNE